MIELLINTMTWMYLTVAIIGLVLFKKLTLTFKFVLAIQIYILFHEQYLSSFATTIHDSQFFVHLYCVIMAILFFGIYSTLIKSSAQLRPIQVFSGFSLVAIILNTIFLQDMYTMPTIGINILQLLVIFNACMLFMYLLDKPNSIPMIRDAVFWFNTSTFIYYATSYFIFTIPYFLISNQISVNTTGSINVFLCWLYYPIIGYSFYLNANRAKYETSN